MNRATWVPLLAACLLAPALTGCGSTLQPSGDGDGIVLGTTDSFALSGEAPAPFDPAQAYESGSWNVMRNAFQTLMRLPRSAGEPIPEAATRCGFADRRNEQYRCTLRSGMQFANGHALTAEDVKFSIKRVLRIKHEGGPASLLANIDAVETPADDEIVFHLGSPDATFPYKLATPAASIVDSETYDKDALRKGFHVDGSGPYSLETKVRHGRAVSAVFTRNPHYKGPLKPKNNLVAMRFLADSAALETALKKGDIDLMTRTLSPAQVTRLQRGAGKGVELIETPGQEVRWVVFDTDDPTVGRDAVRKAIAYLVDRPALVRDVYERTAKPLYSVVPNGIGSHVNSFFNAYGDGDADAARKTLRKAGVTTPVRFELTYPTDHYGPAIAQEFRALQAQLNGSGLFQVTLQGVPWRKYLPASTQGRYEAYGIGWSPDFPDADNFIAPFFAEDNPLGITYRNSKIRNELIPWTRQRTRRAAADPGFQEIQDIVADEVPVLPLWQGQQYVAAREDITGAEWTLNSSSVLQLWELGRGGDAG